MLKEEVPDPSCDAKKTVLKQLLEDNIGDKQRWSRCLAPPCPWLWHVSSDAWNIWRCLALEMASLVDENSFHLFCWMRDMIADGDSIHIVPIFSRRACSDGCAMLYHASRQPSTIVATAVNGKF